MDSIGKSQSNNNDEILWSLWIDNGHFIQIDFLSLSVLSS